LVKKTKEYRVFGPPGTGKTTYLTQQIQAAAEKHGIESILVASFTKTAAQELAGRNIEAEGSIGTLHSHCYRAIGFGEIAETKISDFNKEFPHFRLSAESGAVSVEDNAFETGPIQKTLGDELLHRMNVLRARMIPMDLWPQNVKIFRSAWQTFKRVGKLIDFTDMIEIAYYDLDTAPGLPKIGFFDEAQDFTPLELALVRKWGKEMDYIVICGDDDQLLYSWLGASTDVFLEGEPDIKKVLSQSFRVPRAVHAYAEKWVSQIRHREPKEYKPRDFEGEVRFLEDGSCNNPDAIIKDAEKYIEQGKTIMFLASCSYMLAGIIERLKKQGILFHNPYRLKQGQWNPIRLNAGEGKISTVQRLLAYLAGCPEIAPEPRLWTLDEFKQWVAIVNSKGNLRHGAKKLLEGKAGGVFEVNYRDLIEAFDEESSFWKALDDFGLDTALNWFQNNVQAAKVKTLEFPIAIIRKQRTYDCLRQKPKCIVGTIHSVKGGEAEVVYLMPDLSVAGMQEYIKGGEGRDAVNRMFYVGITRARESLILCGPGTNFSVRWDI
jgi:DNA helicase-2/ATP-dependent DNA helicase PcrA